MTLDEFIALNGVLAVKEAGEYLFRQGEHEPCLYLVRSGLLKAYYLSADGKESIKSFLLPGDNIGSLMSIYARKPSSFSVVCLKACELTIVEFSALYEASKTDTQISTAMIDFLMGFGISKEVREYELLCLTAQERYIRLQEKMPDILELVTQNEIARYLGITPVGLSRIKKRVGG